MGPAVGLPDKPELWEGTGELGAKAAAVWFLRDLYRYVLETNDTAEWERLSTDDCEFCASTVDMAANNGAAGRAYRQDVATWVSVESYRELNPLSYSVVLLVEQPTIQEFSSGQWIAEHDPDPTQVLVVLHREGPEWLLRAGQAFGVDEEIPEAGDAP